MSKGRINVNIGHAQEKNLTMQFKKSDKLSKKSWG